MDRKKNVLPHVITDLNLSIEDMVKNASGAVIAFNLEGRILAVNSKAAHFFAMSPQKCINLSLVQNLSNKTYAYKRLLIKSLHCVQRAQKEMVSQFTWREKHAQKPTISYHVMIYKMNKGSEVVFFAHITDVSQEKMTEWVLWSLAKITNHLEITDVIDDILKLLSEVFSADYAAVSLIDGQNIARPVSYFQACGGRKIVSYALEHSPCEKVLKCKSICWFNDIQKQFPKAPLLKDMKIKSYFAGPIINNTGKVVGVLTILKKQTLEIHALDKTLFRLFLERINLEIERLLNQRRLQFLASIPQQDPNPVIRFLPAGSPIFANAAGQLVLDYWMTSHSGLPTPILKAAQEAMECDQVVQIEYDANNIIYLFTLIWLADFKQINLYGTDISQLKTQEKNMLMLTRFDSLTQVANRQYFDEILLEKIHQHRVEGKELALLLLDLDDFKIINDTLGHAVGDMLLKAVTQRMVHCLRKEDFIARLGGDEFVILHNHSSLAESRLIAKKILRVLARQFQFSEYQMKISASIGIALYPAAGLSSGELLKNADMAMYEAKKEGKNKCVIFSNTLHHAQDRQHALLRKDLKVAVLQNELYLEYQPQFDLVTNQMIGFEVLLRWLHPVQGLILPTEFLTIADQTGCIHEISRWMINQSLKDFITILSINPAAELAINLSLSQINNKPFLNSLSENLLKYNVDKKKIILDLAERSIALHLKNITRRISEIKKAGFRLSLDSFGNPQTSIPRLLSLPLEYIKLDPVLLKGVEKNRKQKILLKGIINLAKDLKLKIIQKGIETKTQAQIIKSIGCPYAQGHYYCEPLRIEALIELLTMKIDKDTPR